MNPHVLTQRELVLCLLVSLGALVEGIVLARGWVHLGPLCLSTNLLRKIIKNFDALLKVHRVEAVQLETDAVFWRTALTWWNLDGSPLPHRQLVVDTPPCDTRLLTTTNCTHQHCNPCKTQCTHRSTLLQRTFGG